MSASTKLKFKVHTATRDTFAAKATIEGEEVDVKVDGLVVELVSEDGSMTQTLRLRRDVDALAEKFVEGAEVTATYTVTEAK